MLKLVARMSNFFAVFALHLSSLRNYFNGPTKLFSDLYVVKFLDTSAKLFFSFNNQLRIGITNQSDFGRRL